ncbi:MAG TPA: hypothetical protein VJ805_00290 [Nitrospiraceae bacterium]|nr:hypothetical protein [Nitrospiraceae bacterium]
MTKMALWRPRSEQPWFVGKMHFKVLVDFIAVLMGAIIAGQLIGRAVCKAANHQNEKNEKGLRRGWHAIRIQATYLFPVSDFGAEYIAWWDAMKWIKKKPTAPGFYWYQSPGGQKRVVEIRKDPTTRKLYVVQTGALLDELPEDEYRWAGPIPEPTEHE